VRDIKAKFVQYRSLSEKQIALVHKLAHEVANPAPAEVHVPAPEGRRITFRGVLVSIKQPDPYEYGFASTKCTVKVTTPNGTWLAWGTIPQGCYDYDGERTDRGLIGCEVEITATLKRGRDAHFALMSRPNGRTLGLSAAAKAAKDAADAEKAAKLVAERERVMAELQRDYPDLLEGQPLVESKDVTAVEGNERTFTTFASDIGLTCEKLAAAGWPSMLRTTLGNGQALRLSSHGDTRAAYAQDGSTWQSSGPILLIVHND
jgi:hypothetical protein